MKKTKKSVKRTVKVKPVTKKAGKKLAPKVEVGGVKFTKKQQAAVNKIITDLTKKFEIQEKTNESVAISTTFLKLASEEKVSRAELTKVKKYVSRMINDIKNRPVAPTPLATGDALTEETLPWGHPDNKPSEPTNENPTT